MKVGIVCVALLTLPGLVRAGDGGKAADLSDAMKSSASGDQTPIEGTSSRHSHDSDYDSDAPVEDLAGSLLVGILGCLHGAEYQEEWYVWQLPVDAGYVIPFNSDIEALTRFSIIPLSMEGERAMLGVYFNGGFVNFKSGSLPDPATSCAWTIGSGLTFRYYFVETEKMINPYVTTQVGWQHLYWNYRNPVVLSSGETISCDGLSALDSYAGLGLTLRRNQRVSFFAEVGFGGMFFCGETSQGFNNDVFDDFGYFSVKAGVSFKF